MRTHHKNCRIFHGDFRSNISIDPFHGCTFVTNSSLSHQVVNIVRPVLNCCVTHTRIFFHNNFYYSRVQRIRRVDRRGAAFYVMHIRTFISDDQSPFKLTHILSIDPEICLQRNLNMNSFGNVNKRATRPYRCI